MRVERKKPIKIKRRRNGKMLIPTGIMALFTIFIFTVGYYNGKHILGLKLAMSMIAEILPLLIFAFISAAMVQVLIPGDLLSRWVGEGSGMRGILVGTLAGALTPGGPYVSLPLAAGLMRSGAGIGTMVAFLTSWSLWAVARLPMEIGIMGWRFTLIRVASVFFFPPVAGLIAQAVNKITLK